ncbi:Peptidyl-prolyl cis-trans isomerase, PpiC-type, partial [Cynara cardunculus var. scolymus]
KITLGSQIVTLPHVSSNSSASARTLSTITATTAASAATTDKPSESATIESDHKRKEPGDQAAAGDHRSKHNHKKSRMSSSSSSDKVRASHILIKHQGSRRKASWKDPEGHIISNTTRDTAVSQLKTLREDIVSGKSKFEDVASRYSDCSSAKRGGDLGSFRRKQMQKPFEDATYALKVGEISEIVDTDSGVHIIKRTG